MDSKLKLQVIACVSVVIALDPPAFIAQLMGVSWGALAGAFLAPFLYGLFWKKGTRAAVVTCFIFGTGLEIVQLCISMKWFSVQGILGFVFTNSLYSGVFAMVGGLIIFPIVSLLTQKTKPNNCEEKFACFKK